jgi:hypothetical protein
MTAQVKLRTLPITASKTEYDIWSFDRSGKFHLTQPDTTPPYFSATTVRNDSQPMFFTTQTTD